MVRPRDAAMALSLVAAVLLGLDRPSLWLVLSVVALAVLLAGARDGSLDQVPLAFVVVLAYVAAALLASGVVGVRPLHQPVAATVLLLLVNAVTAVAGWRRRWRPAPDPVPWSWVSYVPFAVTGLLAVVTRLDRWQSLEWFLSGDHLRHLALVVRMADSGALEYQSQSYPRGWHALVASLWASGRPVRDQQGLEDLVHVHAMASWLSVACLVLALSTCARWVHRRVEAPRHLEPLSGFLGGVAFLGPQFMGAYVPRGFETSIAAVLVVVVAAHQALAAPRSRRAVVVASLAMAMTAHLWQILVPSAVAVLGIVLVRRWRADSPRPLQDIVVVALGLAAAAPGFAGAVRGYGLSAAATAGDVPQPLLIWAAVALAACAWVVLRRPGAGLPIVAPVVTAVATAGALVVLLDLPLEAYYPNKTLWAAVVLGLPVIAAGASQVLSVLDGESLLARAGFIVTGAVIALVAGLSLVTPVFGVLGSWSTADGDLVMETVTSPRAPEASVVWDVAGAREDATSQLLLDFYSATARSAPLGLAATTVDAQCALLQQARTALVISNADPGAVKTRFSCAAPVAVVAGPQ